MMENNINQEQFDFISNDDKQFIIDFTKAMEDMGYTCDNIIGNGFCWGKYMIIYRKANVKTKKVVARIYIRDSSIVLRLFFNNVTKHSSFISAAPEYINNVFTGNYGECKHCKGDDCRFRKDYEIDGVKIEKCNGCTFEFYNPTLEKLCDYINLFKEFYPVKRA